MFIRRLADPVIERIERRISLYTHVPVSHQEDIQVLRYEKTQTYGAHYDSVGAGLTGRALLGPKTLCHLGCARSEVLCPAVCTLCCVRHVQGGLGSTNTTQRWCM